VHLNKTAFQSQPLFQEWMSGTLPGEQWQELTAKGWFTTAMTDGQFIWMPVPAIAEVAVKPHFHLPCHHD
jgi:hypothetical protein